MRRITQLSKQGRRSWRGQRLRSKALKSLVLGTGPRILSKLVASEPCPPQVTFPPESTTQRYTWQSFPVQSSGFLPPPSFILHLNVSRPVGSEVCNGLALAYR